MPKGDIRIKLPKPFRVIKHPRAMIPDGGGEFTPPIYEVNSLRSVIYNELSVDKQYIKVRCADRNNLYRAGFRAGIEALIEVLSKPRRKR